MDGDGGHPFFSTLSPHVWGVGGGNHKNILFLTKNEPLTHVDATHAASISRRRERVWFGDRL